MLDKLFGNSTLLTEQYALDGLSARHTAISDNIANVNTPNYKRQQVPFEGALASAVQRTVAASAGTGSASLAAPFRPGVVRDTTTATRADGNNVDIEAEMVGLAENTLRYETLSESVTTYFTDLKGVINSK